MSEKEKINVQRQGKQLLISKKKETDTGEVVFFGSIHIKNLKEMEEQKGQLLHDKLFISYFYFSCYTGFDCMVLH